MPDQRMIDILRRIARRDPSVTGEEGEEAADAGFASQLLSGGFRLTPKGKVSLAGAGR